VWARTAREESVLFLKKEPKTIDDKAVCSDWRAGPIAKVFASFFKKKRFLPH
jgi:hypothetical protein